MGGRSAEFFPVLGCVQQVRLDISQGQTSIPCHNLGLRSGSVSSGRYESGRLTDVDTRSQWVFPAATGDITSRYVHANVNSLRPMFDGITNGIMLNYDGFWLGDDQKPERDDDDDHTDFDDENL